MATTMSFGSAAPCFDQVPVADVSPDHAVTADAQGKKVLGRAWQRARGKRQLSVAVLLGQQRHAGRDAPEHRHPSELTRLRGPSHGESA